MEQRLSIITLGVNDFQKATSFYEDIFGWEKMDSSNESITFFKLNGILLSLYPKEKLAEDAQVPAEGNGFRGLTLAFITRSESEVDELVTKLAAKGTTVVKAPEKAFWGGYSAYIADPEGTLWEIAYNPFLALDKTGNIIS